MIIKFTDSLPFMELVKEVAERYAKHPEKWNTWDSFSVDASGTIIILFQGNYEDAMKVKQFIFDMKKNSKQQILGDASSSCEKS